MSWMYDESDIVTAILNGTSFTNVKVAGELKSVNSQATSSPQTLPEIAVHHLGFTPANSHQVLESAYGRLDTHTLIDTEIQVACAISDQTSVINELRDALVDFSPFPAEADFSSLFLQQATKVAIQGDIVWWRIIVALAGPKFI